MNETTEAETEPSTEEEAALPLGERLLRSATPRERVAVRALVEEGHLLNLDAVKAALVRETDSGPRCSWDHLSVRLHEMGLDDEQRAFVDLVLSTVTSHQTSLARVIGMEPALRARHRPAARRRTDLATDHHDLRPGRPASSHHQCGPAGPALLMC
ncbi:hypothetical protein GCM10023080_016170 [Streptomyces pseudoechinosporeus]